MTVNEMIASGKGHKGLTQSQKRAEEWEQKKADYSAYKQTPEYKEMMSDLCGQVQIHSDYPLDPPYSQRASYNYLYVFNNRNELIAKETEGNEPEPEE